jgi:hypothetical protein
MYIHLHKYLYFEIVRCYIYETYTFEDVYMNDTFFLFIIISVSAAIS